MSEKSNLRSFNLNTLPVLREILRHGSVSKAAQSLHVSQPALSAALKQLRHQFGDQLIVRVHGSIKLTPKAEAMLAPLEQALSAVQQLITPGAEKPSASPVVFGIATTDHIMNLLGAPLVQMLLQEDLQILPHFLSVGGNSAEQLIKGTIDFIIVPKLMLFGSHASSRDLDAVNSELLFSEPLVGIASRDDKTFAKDMTVKEYLEREHVSIALDRERNISIEQVFLAGNSLKQNDVAKFSNYISLLGIVSTTRCIALVPDSLAKVAQSTFELRLFTPPLNFPPMEWTIIWHRRNDDNDNFTSFRQIIKSCVIQVIDRFHPPSQEVALNLSQKAPA